MSIATDVKYDLKRILDRRGEIKVRAANSALPTPVAPTSIVDGGGGTATVTAPSHGLSTSNSVVVFGAYEARFNGTFTITVTDANTFTYAVSNSASATATGDISYVLDAALPAEERFYSLGHIRDAKVTSSPVTTSASTTGKQHMISQDYEITCVLMQTSDAEFAAIEDLVEQPIDVAVFAKACMTQHTQAGDVVADLNNGFLVYDALINFEGEINLDGGESGLTITVPFNVGKATNSLVIGS